MAPLHRELTEILRKHLGPRPRLPREIVAALQDIDAVWPGASESAQTIPSEGAAPGSPGMPPEGCPDRLAQALLETTQDCIALVHPDGRLLAYNQRFVDLWHLPDDVVAKGRFSDILPNILFELREPEHFERWFAEASRGEVSEHREIVEFLDGRYFELFTQPQELPDGTTAQAWAFRNVSQIKRAEEAFRHDAFHDALTGLPNRALFADRLRQAVAQSNRNDQKLAVMFMDLDKFKNVNDTLGHGAGDELLQGVASRLGARVRAQDTLSRLAGDEFMMLITNLPSEDTARHVADSILDSMRLPFRVEGHALQVGASIGIALFPDHATDPDELMKTADVALYQAKEQGRNRYKVFEPGMTNPSTDKMVFENDLREAVAEGHLVVHYQPIVDLASGEIGSVECLVRWRRPDGRLVPPGRFIPVAESTGLIGPITEHVLRVGTSAAHSWKEATGHDIAISVNFSAQQFWDSHLVSQIKAHLELAELPPSSLIVEITESTFMQDPAGGLEMLHTLQDLGVGVAVDDFGTGHSSLSVLRHMPVTALKVDKSFVENCDKDPRDGSIAATIIGLGKSLGLRVIAEGVERKAQAVFLKGQGCDAIQGFWFAKPMTAERFESILAERAQTTPRPASPPSRKAIETVP